LNAEADALANRGIDEAARRARPPHASRDRGEDA